jgi:hypothetical protein
MCYTSNRTGDTSGSGTAYHIPSFAWWLVFSIYSCLCSVLLIIVCICVFFCWSLYCLSFSVGHYIVCLFLLVIILSVFWFTTSVYIHVLYFLNLWYLHFYLVILALIQKSVKDSITRHEHLNIGVTFKIEYNNGKQQIYKGVSIYLT